MIDGSKPECTELDNLAAPGLERVPAWERFSWLRAGFSTRQGGRSTAYIEDQSDADGEQNLGWTAEDDPELVNAARDRFAAELGGGAAFELVTTRQIHGAVSVVIEADHGPLRASPRRSAFEGDGLLTNLPGLLLGVITADCVPVLVADTRTHAVAAFHAGWRGTRARIVERGIGMMQLRFGSRPEDLVAAIGPAIAACCFAVGADVRSEFESGFPYAPALFSQVGESQMHLDLHGANRRQLLNAGLGPEAIQLIAQCTACTRLPNGRRKYFSHRAERGITGRMLSAIGAIE